MNQKGFTLVELLIVVSIIGILSVLTVISIGSVKAKARDSVREHDVNQLAKLLEIHRGINGEDGFIECPDSVQLISEGGNRNTWACSSTDGPTWIQAFVPTYLEAAPTDPINIKPNTYYLITDHYAIETMIQATVPLSELPKYILIYQLEHKENIDRCKTVLPAGEYSTICDIEHL